MKSMKIALFALPLCAAMALAAPGCKKGDKNSGGDNTAAQGTQPAAGEKPAENTAAGGDQAAAGGDAGAAAGSDQAAAGGDQAAAGGDQAAAAETPPEATETKDVPTEEDFEEKAKKDITEKNLESDVTKMEKELGTK